MGGSKDMPTLHGSAAVIGQQGVLIQGASGTGKSTLVHALIAEGQRRNIFATWVGDDQLSFETRDSTLLVGAAQPIAGKAEQALNGIINVEHIPTARIDLLVRLQYAPTLERMPENLVDTRFPAIKLIAVPERQIDISVPLIFTHLDLM